MPDPSPLIHSPHDKFFKEQFSRIEVARDFFQTYLPPAIAQAADWETLQLLPGHFVDERLTAQSSDLLYSVQLAGAPLLLYLLFEHKSRPDVWTRFQMLQYVVRIWEQWLKTERLPGGVEGKLPPILPFVLHQGETDWNLSTQFTDLVAIPEALTEALVRFQPNFEHALLDLHRVPLAELSGGVLLHVALTLMKAVREGTVTEWLEVVAPHLAELLEHPDQAGLLRVFLRYLTQAEARIGPSTFHEAARKLNLPQLKSTVMTIEEAIKQEGRQEGWQEGRQEGRQEGTVIGRIQFCQELLGLPIIAAEDLAQRGREELQNLLRELEGRVRHPLRGAP